MKERWKAIARILEEEYDLEVQPSYEGWGAGYDPKYLPALEMWAKGEVEDVPPGVRKPRGISFNIVDFMRKNEDYIVNSIRHEISFLLNTEFPHWRIGQREVFRAGYVPSSFVVLMAVLESIRADERIIKEMPSSIGPLRRRMKEVLSKAKAPYPHHRLALSIAYRWMGEQDPYEDETAKYWQQIEKPFYEYLGATDPQTLYDILMEDIWTHFRPLVDTSRDLNYIDLLLDEAGERRKREAHRGRIMTDVLRKLPPDIQQSIREFKEMNSWELPEELRRSVLKALGSLQDWMKDYIRQMSWLDTLEKDLAFLSSFLPKTLEVDVEHRGFVSFIFKGWEETAGASSALTIKESIEDEELSQMDRQFKKEHGLTEREFERYRVMMRSVLPYVEHFKRKFDSFLPQEEECWGGCHPRGKRLNFRKIPTEVPIKRGRIFSRREVPEKKDLAFELLIDISSSMKKQEKITNAIRSLLLVSEVLEKMEMPFSIKVFSENVYLLKDYSEDYLSVKSRIMELPSSAGGGTDLGKAISIGTESLEVFTKSTHRKGIIVLFTDGEPTKGLKGNDLKLYISQMKKKVPIVGVGVGKATPMVREYFDRTGISVDDISKLPSAFSFIIENQLKRLISVN